MNLKSTKKTKLLENLRYLPLIIIGILFMFFALHYKKLSVEDILNFTPSNYFLAGIIMILIFAIKSVSMIIPLTVLYISSSILFSWYWAIIVNLIGLFVCMTIPYYIGKFSGKNLVDKLISKYPKVNKINNIKAKNEWIFVFIVKILGFIPNEISSIILGSLNTEYKTFAIASVIAKSPSMIATTLLGANINQPGTLGFKLSISIAILAFIFIVFIYWKNRHTIKS